MLSKKAKYAIKALILLGKKNGEALQIAEIAGLAHIPKRYLESIMLDLRNAGYLYSKRGNNGGYVLVVSPENISLDKIVRLMDGPISRVSCASTFHYHRCEECIDETTCSIKHLFVAVREADLRLLEATTIADMAQRESGLNK